MHFLTWITTRRGSRSFSAACIQASRDNLWQSIIRHSLFRSCSEIPGWACNPCESSKLERKRKKARQTLRCFQEAFSESQISTLMNVVGSSSRWQIPSLVCLYSCIWVPLGRYQLLDKVHHLWPLRNLGAPLQEPEISHTTTGCP